MNSVFKQHSFANILRFAFNCASIALFFGLPLAFASAATGFVTRDICTNEKDTLRVLHNAGYADVVVGGGVHPFIKRSNEEGIDYSSATRFKAVGANGQIVTGYVNNKTSWLEDNSNIVFERA